MMQAGKYYVGDLCYVMGSSEWDQVCELVIEGHTCKEGEFQLSDGRRFAMYNTKYGDGQYSSSIGTKHSVDSGSIGCIRVEDIRANKYSDIERLGAIVEFSEPFNTSTDGSTLQFGMVFVDTGEDFDYEEEDEEGEYYDYEKDEYYGA